MLTHGWDDKSMARLLHGHVLPLTCFYKGWNKPRASDIPVGPCAKRKLELVIRKLLRISGWRQQSMKPGAGSPRSPERWATAEAPLSEGGPGWQIGEQGAGHTVIPVENYMGSHFWKKFFKIYF